MIANGFYHDEHLEIDFESCAVFLDGRRLTLTRKEYELLSLLAVNAGEIVPRDVLLQRVWGYNREIRTRTLDVHVRRLRKKLAGFGGQYIETVFGVGYRFERFRSVRAIPAWAPGMLAALPV
jgi:DNA-binding response OmpR family regulator